MAISSAAFILSTRPTSPLPLSSSNSSLFTTSKSLFTQHNNNSRSLLISSRVSKTKPGLSCTCLFGLGMPELVVIAVVAALVFGPKKLPEVGRSIGKTVKSFQQAAKEFESELKKEPDSSTGMSKEEITEVGQEEKQDVNMSTTTKESF